MSPPDCVSSGLLALLQGTAHPSPTTRRVLDMVATPLWVVDSNGDVFSNARAAGNAPVPPDAIRRALDGARSTHSHGRHTFVVEPILGAGQASHGALVVQLPDAREAGLPPLDAQALLDMLETVTDGVWHWHIPDGRDFLSPKWKRQLGYEPHELPNSVETWHQLLDEQDRSRALSAVRAHLDEGQPYDIRVRYVTKTGGTAWMRSLGRVVRDDQGQPVEMLGIHVDETRYRETVRELRASKNEVAALNADLERRVRERTAALNGVFQCLPTAALTLDLEGLITGANPAACSLFNRPEYELVGTRLADYRVKHAHGGAQGVDAILRAGGYTFRARITEHSTLSLTGDETGRTVFIEDRDAVTTGQVDFERVVDASYHGLLAVGHDGIIYMANDTVSRMFGFAAHELIGQPLEILVPDARRGMHAGLRAAYMNDPRARQMGGSRTDLYGRRRSGDDFPVDVGLTPLDTRHGAMVLCTIRDRTEELERLHAERVHRRALEDRNEGLIHANAELDRFAYVASHDLRAPLRAIRQLTSAIHEDLGESVQDATAEMFELVRSRVDRMENLIQALLAYSRTARTVHLEQVHTGDEAADLAAMFERSAPSFPITVADDMPVVHTDRTLLRQILQNLMENAIRHHDAQAGSIHIDTVQLPEETHIRVTDDGPGVDPAFRERVFEVFRTLKPRDQLEASGVGLSIVQKATSALGGHAFISDRDDGRRGTTVVVALPRSPQESHE